MVKLVRHIPRDEGLAEILRQQSRSTRDAQRASGTEKARTMDTAIQAATDSEFAKDLAEQLEGELGPLPGQIQDALDEAGAALVEAGLARSDAATAVSDAQAAVAEAEQAILDAAAASGAASVADGKAAAAQVVAQSALADAEVALARAGVSEVFIQGVAPRVNYAPSLYGPTVPVEVRRNLEKNPRAVASGDTVGYQARYGWARTFESGSVPPFPGGPLTYARLTAPATPASGTSRGFDMGRNIDLPPAVSPVAYPVTPGTYVKFFVATRASFDTAKSTQLRFHDGAGNWVPQPITAVNTPLVLAGQWSIHAVTALVPEGAAFGAFRNISLGSTSFTGGETWDQTAVLIVTGNDNSLLTVSDYFDGNTSPDPDMAARWLGTPNASEGVLEGQHPVGFTDTNCVSIIHEVGDGTRELRQIPTSIIQNSYSQFIGSNSIVQPSTLIATARLQQPLIDPQPFNSRNIRTIAPDTQAPQPPNAAGVFPQRLTSEVTSAYRYLLMHGGRAGSGDVYWSEIGLFAGDYDGPNLVMENILWIDTTGGANTPKRWSGSAWAAITDKVAVDAAAAAVAAQTKADSAFDEAVDAATAAGNAQTSANGKNRVWYQGTAPAGTGHKPGDTWFDTSNGNRVTQWDGDSWEATQFGTGAIATAAITNALIADATIQSAKIANLDAAKITTGTLDAARIAALSISTGHLAANAVTAAKIAALTITAAEIASNAVTAIKIAANAVTAEKINAGAVTTVKLDALAVTAEKIAAGAIIADKIAANAITTAKLAADAIDGMTITGATVRTAPSGQRLQLDVLGLRAFNESGQQTAQLSAGTGGLQLNGRQTITSSTEPGGIELEVIDNNGPRMVVSGSASDRGTGYFSTGKANSQNNKHLYINTPADNDLVLGAGEDLSLRSNDRTEMWGFNTAVVAAGNEVQVRAPRVVATSGSGPSLASVEVEGVAGGKVAVTAAEFTRNGRPIAFGFAGGRIPADNIAPNDQLQATVTFPPGRFTVAPVVTSTIWESPRDTNVSVKSITATSMVVDRGNFSTVIRTVGAQWMALQMLPSAASG